MSDAFSKEYFLGLINDESAQKKSAKAFLATEQTVPGLGNGVLQDILYHAHIHPKKKIAALTDKEKENLFYQVKETMNDIYRQGGRNTESDLFGEKKTENEEIYQDQLHSNLYISVLHRSYPAYSDR